MVKRVVIIRSHYYKLFCCLLFSLALSCCSFFEPEFEPFTSPATPQAVLPNTLEADHPTTTVPVVPLPEKKINGDDSIVIKWLVPEEELDGYVIRYGFSATSLEFEERLTWKEIKIIQENSQGKIFVHNLKDLPTDKTIYVSLAGVKDEKISKPTAIFSVNPITKTPASSPTPQ